MILTNEEIMQINQTAEFDSAIGYARKIEQAVLESYKAELLKEVGEPFAAAAWVEGMCFVEPTDGNDYPVEHEPLFTSDQVAAAIAKATKPLIEERDRAVKRMEAGWIEVCDSGILAFKEMNDELHAKLVAAQEENGRLENQVLARDAELWGRTQEILGLKDQLTKAEQRVAEACALQVATETKFHWLDAARVAKEIRSGEWRKFVKEV